MPKAVMCHFIYLFIRASMYSITFLCYIYEYNIELCGSMSLTSLVFCIKVTKQKVKERMLFEDYSSSFQLLFFSGLVPAEPWCALRAQASARR